MVFVFFLVFTKCGGFVVIFSLKNKFPVEKTNEEANTQDREISGFSYTFFSILLLGEIL